ncbi:hypothetical protein KDA_37270 [Dictyobacter alpinus]|uniref:Uncharacterized protein n=1 Tax=Dictyobacter alpinus TaxID=2014873 RepID=A0A402BA15_9CHLR|nr:hypothetical protein KDA_37270 [Dictyobacter alpinus]
MHKSRYIAAAGEKNDPDKVKYGDYQDGDDPKRSSKEWFGFFYICIHCNEKEYEKTDVDKYFSTNI